MKVPASALTHSGSLSIQTDLVDQHCYVFEREAVFQALENKPAITAIKEVQKSPALLGSIVKTYLV